jgi:hypothetical protein
VVISQAAATSCIQVPMFDTTAANQISANACSRSGAQAPAKRSLTGSDGPAAAAQGTPEGAWVVGRDRAVAQAWA